MKLVIKIPIWEYEKGWGPRLDDHMVCLSKEDAEKFVEEFNSKNNKSIVPDWYMKAEHQFQPIDITDEQYELVTKSEGNRTWLSSL